MLSLTLGNNDDKIVVTLTEFVTITEPYFLFVFTNVTTRQVVNVIFSTPDDLSGYDYRYNEFEINTQAVFAGCPNGEWHYIAYQQTSTTNTDPALSSGVVEYGKMILYPVTGFAYTEYNLPTTYKAYNG